MFTSITSPSVLPHRQSIANDRGRQTLDNFGIACLALVIPVVGLALVDDREVLGVDNWIKPIKFLLSTGIYSLTLGWVLGYLNEAQRASRAARYVVWATVGSAVPELAIIFVRAALAQQSHFNTATFGDTMLYNLMAVGALVLVSTSAVAGRLITKGGVLTGSRRLGWSSGLLLAGTFGAVTGMVMGSRTSSTVGTPTDGRTVPFLGWSMSVGDLRISHFLALHAMFVLPLVGFLTDRYLGRRAALRVTQLAAALFTILIVASMANALATRPL